MNVRGSKLLAVLTAAVLTLASGTIQAYASFCQPAEKVEQESCCPSAEQDMQAEACTMDGCDCTIESQPTKPDQSPINSAPRASTWDFVAIADSDQPPSIDDEAPISDVVATYRDRAPPTTPDLFGNGLRGPPSPRA